MSNFKFDVRIPRILIGLPFHPALKNLPYSCIVSKHVFHIDVLIPMKYNTLLQFPEQMQRVIQPTKHLSLQPPSHVPELINSWKQYNSPVPNISCTVDVLVFHFHFCILQPNCRISVVHVNEALVNGASASNVILTDFPRSIFHPHSWVHPLHANSILELFPLSGSVSWSAAAILILTTIPVLCQLLRIRNPLFWRLDLGFLNIMGFAQDLFSCNLDGSSRLVFHTSSPSGCWFFGGHVEERQPPTASKLRQAREDSSRRVHFSSFSLQFGLRAVTTEMLQMDSRVVSQDTEKKRLPTVLQP